MYTAQDIVEKLRKGIEVEAITVYLYQTYQLPIKQQARKLGVHPDDTKDMVQEVMIAFLKNVLAGTYEPHEDSSLGGYLCKIATRISLKMHRGNSRRDNREDEYTKSENDNPTPEELLIEKDYIKRGWETFNCLCQACRQILTAYYRDELPIAEIAKVYNLGTAEAVKVRKFRCMKELKKLLKL